MNPPNAHAARAVALMNSRPLSVPSERSGESGDVTARMHRGVLSVLRRGGRAGRRRRKP